MTTGALPWLPLLVVFMLEDDKELLEPVLLVTPPLARVSELRLLPEPLMSSRGGGLGGGSFFLTPPLPPVPLGAP